MSDTIIPDSLFPDSHNSFSSNESEGTLATYSTISTNTDLQINLVGSSPLYGHILTHACLYLAKYIEKNADSLIVDKTVLEVGSGGALPSILSAHLGAKYVISTDYPDCNLINNINKNIIENKVSKNCSALGFIWGNPVDEIVSTLNEKTNKETFDIIILSDVIFNHSEHLKLLTTCRQLLTPQTGKILVTFSPHRPKLFNNDMHFFELAQEEPFNFHSEFIEMEHWSPLFKDDTDESTVEIRSRVYFYILS
ncbi:nicotinamide n-methyltransferase [Pichia californica]|uniref:Nicotinamide n-methyltransferase n=1 Tax=Pichia californica TaxID=460514 RepID=A0A9P6WLM0_9ASCO|nr:nicotinamide n-methyltransferase [[Candida] californica]KAG0689275.1 nicotinamide n-methyltransferase [[Candida] californica]